jgi:hypothetical protein
MATAQAITGGREGAILARLFRPDDKLPPEAARALLEIRFDREELDRIHDLPTRNQDSDTTPTSPSQPSPLSPSWPPAARSNCPWIAMSCSA